MCKRQSMETQKLPMCVCVYSSEFELDDLFNLQTKKNKKINKRENRRNKKLAKQFTTDSLLSVCLSLWMSVITRIPIQTIQTNAHAYTMPHATFTTSAHFHLAVELSQLSIDNIEVIIIINRKCLFILFFYEWIRRTANHPLPYATI